MTWAQLVLVVLAGTVVSAVALALVDSYRLTNPPGYVHPRPASFEYFRTPMSAHGLAFEDVEFGAPDGSKIRGWLVPPADSDRDLAIVTVHGRGGDRQGFLPHLSAIHDAGAASVMIDLRENGLSDGKGRGMSLGHREAEDITTVVRSLKQRGYRRVVVYGCSLGAVAAIIAAAEESAIDGVIAESSLESFSAYMRDVAQQRFHKLSIGSRSLAGAWGSLVVEITRLRLGLARLVHPIDAISHIAPRPLLLVHGTADDVISIDHTQHLAERTDGHAQLIALQGAGHCDGFASPGVRRAFLDSFLHKLVSAHRQPDKPPDP